MPIEIQLRYLDILSWDLFPTLWFLPYVIYERRRWVDNTRAILLKGVNDNTETMKKLMQGLVSIRVRPYYIYQCDPIKGANHFRTRVEKGLEIIKGIRGYTSGLCVPHFVIDAPGGGGKIPLLPEYLQSIDDDKIVLKNYENKVFEYIQPV